MSTYLASLNRSLHQLLQADDAVLVMGEDIVDPYGGAFKVTQGLSSQYPNRVMLMPICEASIVGFASGLSLRGFKPIVEIMFGDFLTLCMDQIFNHLVKFQQMYQLELAPKVVIRTPMGGGRGYGPTHSQSIEKHFLGLPGLTVLAPSHWHRVEKSLSQAVQHLPGPVLFIENKLLYTMRVDRAAEPLQIAHHDDGFGTEVVEVRNYSSGEPDVTVIGYGGVSRLLAKAMDDWLEDEIQVKVLLPERLSPLPQQSISHLCHDAKRILIVEEGMVEFGWGSELASCLYSGYYRSLEKPIVLHGALNGVIPTASQLEAKMLVSTESIEHEVDQLLGL